MSVRSNRARRRVTCHWSLSVFDHHCVTYPPHLLHHCPMKQHMLALGLSLITTTAIWAQEVEWSANWGGDGVAYLGSFPLVTADGDGNSYSTCNFGGTVDMHGHVINGPGVFLAKLNEVGVTQWVKRFGESTGSPMILNEERPLGIAYDPLLDEVVVVGAYNTRLIFDHDTLHPNVDPESPRLYIARFASDGECLWARYATNGPENVQIALDASSALHIVGSFGGEFQGTPAISVSPGGCHAVYSATGDLLSAERFLTGGTIGGMCMLPNGKFAVTFRTTTNVQLFGEPLELELGSGYTSAVVQTDLAGAVDWVFPMRAQTNGVSAVYCRSTDNGRILFNGGFHGDLYTPTDTISSVLGGPTLFIASMDPLGALQWVRTLDSENTIYFGQQFDTDADGNVYLQGSFRESMAVAGAVLTANTSDQGFLVKLDTAGICRAAWDCGKVSGPWGGVVVADDGLYTTCTFDSAFHFADVSITPEQVLGGYRSIFIAHLDSLSGFTGVQTLTGGGPQALHIFANPNNGICTLELPESLQPTPDLLLSVYDNTGQLVQRAPLLFSENGVVLDIRAQAKGVYHVELGDGQQRYTGTIVFE
ncbi:MAG: T9SS type A sorting domain-containing protein [Flavobacteriales bacterium]|nr:MAG: T9SS type A sorting domain-containing protein [Flavobacteriales bacterium]